MRTKKSLKGASISMVLNILTLLIGLVSQAIFIKILGKSYLGVNGLFNNIVSMLAIVELGIGPAIIYNLYKPIADNDIETTKSLMAFYKKCYKIIAIIILLIGLMITPFINQFVDVVLDTNIYLIFILFIIDSAASYVYSYKRSILQADQNSYIISLVHIGYVVLLNLFQLSVLIISGNYLLFLIIKIIIRVIENIILSIIADKLYPFLTDKNYKQLDKDILLDIKQKVKGLFFHKIGGFLVTGTDNIIISKFLGVVLVGLYSNYYMIISAAYILISQIFSSFTASVGNLIVAESKEHSYKIYKVLMMLNFWVYSIASCMIYIIMEPFISIWIGSEFVLPNAVLIILCVNFYMLGMRASIGLYKDASGIFWEDRYVPIIESTINIVVSIILVQKIGMVGVFIGTFLSSLIVVFFSLPYYVYKKIFEKSILEYYKLYFKYLIISVGAISISKICSLSIIPNSLILKIVMYAVISIFIPMIINILILYKTDEYKYLKNLAWNIIKNIGSKIKR
ncbi:hypothetical protein H7E67_14515 [Clostridium gasigenes]|uniref:lipopolysaccharide biosynthesis protein n=1 Tax=Clostridium gasigenes TaxID=94869 RepID=UPI0016257F5F|nr:hypothetical protein [Clostridium gasigenes]MBB6624650.1 hypothetical protein [Clostridium gasigenes]MBU3137158.1 hypothetical protein [Clostridium gasigenes]